MSNNCYSGKRDINITEPASGAKRRKKDETSVNKQGKNDYRASERHPGDSLEIEYCQEGDIEAGFKNCQKESRHSEFTSINEFSVNHLPEGYRNELFFDFTKSFAALVVRLKVRMLSLERKSYNKYLADKKMGDYFGSGWVSRMGNKFTEQSKQFCKCNECRNSATPATTWAEIIVSTAKHVVFNTEEALSTRFDLFYDKFGSPDTSFGGLIIKSSDFKKDIVEVTCVTHDISLWEKLKILCEECDKLHTRVKNHYVGGHHKLVVIVSHPHGLEKKVSIGEWVSRKSHSDGDVQYMYTAPTCGGSSGAPVFVMGRNWCHMFSDHPHLGIHDDHLNKCGFGPS